MTFEQYRANCRRAGEVDEDIERTWKLMETIEKILKDEDVDPFMAPEMVLPQKARLARLFIEFYKESVKSGDRAIIAWLYSLAEGGNPKLPEIVEAIEKGEHWRWWHDKGRHRD